MDNDIVKASDNAELAPRHNRSDLPGRPRRPRQSEPPEYPEFLGIELTQRQKYLVAAVALLIALICIFPLGAHYSSAKTYQKTIDALDNKLETVTTLMAGSTGTSAAISLLPGDAGTPIAEQLVDLSSDFLIVLSAIYLEKYLLTILGFVAFRILIPVGLLLLVGQLFVPWYDIKRFMLGFGTKLFFFGFAIAFVVPTSVWVSSKIEETYQESINETISQAEQTVNDIENEVEAEGAEAAAATEPAENTNVISQFVENITGGVSQLTENARSSLNRFVEALAVLIVTSCVIPILVLLFFLWLLKIILGVEIHLPMPRSARGFTRR